MKPSIESRNTKRISLADIDLAWSEDLPEPSDQAPFVSRLWQRLRLGRRDHVLPEIGLPARPGLLLLTGLLLIVLCALLASWRFGPRANKNEISLLADSSSSKLNSTSAEPAKAEAGPIETAAKLLPETPGPDLAVFVPPVPDYSDTIQNAHRGDSPMTRTWKKLGLQTVLAAAVTTFPVLAADPEKPVDVAKEFAEVQKQLKDIKTALADLPPVKADTKKLREDATAQSESSKSKFDGIETQLRELKTTLADLQGIKADLKKLKDDATENVLAAQLKNSMLNERISKLEESIAGLKNQLQTSSSRISAFPPTAPSTPPTGRIRLNNSFATPVTVFVNSRAYTLAPSETRDLEPQPAGAFQYEVLASAYGIVQPRKTVSLNPNETFTITVYTR